MTTHDEQRHVRVLGFIASYVERNGYAPSLKEIREAVGLASSSTVLYYLGRLEKDGYIRRGPHRTSRTLVVTPEGRSAIATSVPA